MKYLVIILSSCLFFLLSCDTKKTPTAPNTPNKTIGKVKSADFAQRLKATTNAQLIDVRTPEEFAKGHIEGAVNINYYDKDFSQQITLLDKNHPVFIYCKSGGRSGKSTKMLEKIGFNEVYDLEDGYMGWNN